MTIQLETIPLGKTDVRITYEGRPYAVHQSFTSAKASNNAVL